MDALLLSAEKIKIPQMFKIGALQYVGVCMYGFCNVWVFW